MTTTKNPELILPENDQKASAMAEAALVLATNATSILVRNADEDAAAAGVLATIATTAREMEAARTSMKKPVLDAGRAIDAFFNPRIERLNSARRMITQARGRWHDEQERARLAEQKRLDDERRANEEKARADREAADKLALEAQKKLDEVPADDFAGQIEAAKQADVANAMVTEATAKVVEVVSAPTPTFAPPPTTAKVATALGATASVGMRKVKKIRITNAALVPRQYCEPVQSKLNAALKLDPSVSIPGCEVYEEHESRVS